MSDEKKKFSKVDCWYIQKIRTQQKAEILEKMKWFEENCKYIDTRNSEWKLRWIGLKTFLEKQKIEEMR